MSFEENTALHMPSEEKDKSSILELVGINPSYERRMDAAILREHALQTKALLAALPPAEQQEWDCLREEIQELGDKINAEILEKSPRSSLGHIVLPTAGRKPITSEQIYKIIHEE